MPAIGFTQSAVDTANTNRDGSGTLVEVFEVTASAGEYIDRIECYPLGTNAATEGVLIASNGQGLANPRNQCVIGREALQATTAGTPAAGDNVTFTIGGWFPKGYIIYALVHAAQASGRHFVAYSDSSYQHYSFSYEEL